MFSPSSASDSSSARTDGLDKPLFVDTTHRPSCPRCRGFDLVTAHRDGEVVCFGCGLVVDERIVDETNEIRRFADSDKPSQSRVADHAADELWDGSLSTGISGPTNRLSTIHSRLSGSDSAVRTARKLLLSWARHNDIDKNILMTTLHCFHGVYVKGGQAVRSLEAKLAACLSYVLREYQQSRRRHEIIAICKLDAKSARLYQNYFSKLESNRPTVRLIGRDASSSSAGSIVANREEEILPNLCRQLNLPFYMERAIREVNDQIRKELNAPSVSASKMKYKTFSGHFSFQVRLGGVVLYLLKRTRDEDLLAFALDCSDETEIDISPDLTKDFAKMERSSTSSTSSYSASPKYEDVSDLTHSSSATSLDTNFPHDHVMNVIGLRYSKYRSKFLAQKRRIEIARSRGVSRIPDGNDMDEPQERGSEETGGASSQRMIYYSNIEKAIKATLKSIEGCERDLMMYDVEFPDEVLCPEWFQKNYGFYYQTELEMFASRIDDRGVFTFDHLQSIRDAYRMIVENNPTLGGPDNSKLLWISLLFLKSKRDRTLHIISHGLLQRNFGEVDITILYQTVGNLESLYPRLFVDDQN